MYINIEYQINSKFIYYRFLFMCTYIAAGCSSILYYNYLFPTYIKLILQYSILFIYHDSRVQELKKNKSKIIWQLSHVVGIYIYVKRVYVKL